MAQYINMQQMEYDEVQVKLAAIHEEILTGEETIRKKIIELTQIEGGFYVEQISVNITNLLIHMNACVLSQIKDAFESTDQSISAFVDTVIGVDVLD